MPWHSGTMRALGQAECWWDHKPRSTATQPHTHGCSQGRRGASQRLGPGEDGRGVGAQRDTLEARPLAGHQRHLRQMNVDRLGRHWRGSRAGRKAVFIT
ncbi:hypothetical protein E2C01_016234 [Portunus trituberculatus]|uniref:Uncharacterized protein n=1 Tax=Portunus trituberculatus TaxID=210409 RepID=A0A5B7DPQ7_PORTR|nr:hypothetical protein [Portunus trituberculatus]